MASPDTTRRREALRWAIAAFIGVLFLFTAWAKAQDVYGFILKASYYRQVPSAWMLPLAVATIGGEVLLGVLFLCRLWLRRIASPVALLLLLLFSALITHAWVRFGIEDCGCLGSLAETPPGASLGKNVVLSSLVVWLFRAERLRAGSSPRRLGLAAGLMLAIGSALGALLWQQV